MKTRDTEPVQYLAVAQFGLVHLWTEVEAEGRYLKSWIALCDRVWSRSTARGDVLRSVPCVKA